MTPPVPFFASGGRRYAVRPPNEEGGNGPPSAPSEPNDVRRALRGKRLVLVDDDPDMLEMLAAALDGLGAEVRLAENAADAFALCNQQPPDVLVSDIGMPGEDGYSLMARLRASAEPALADVPAIALTAYVGQEVRKRALAAGFDVYLSKPMDPERLLEFVARLATRGRSA